MAKKGKKSILVRLVSTETPASHFYTAQKNPKGKKLSLRKYNPKTRKHELFEEKKIK